MSGENRIKASSVAAFLFMPQFRLSAYHTSHLMPVFMRTLALMFAQAGLIPQNHPATMYGIQGVKKIGFSELMGEAWFTLRTTKASPYQWSMYISVVLMIVFSIASIFSIVLRMFVSTAQAQIFNHPSGATDFSVVPAISAGSLFDTGKPTLAGGDMAIGLLDKVLRQGANNIGGNFQDALRPLMQVYNTGILVVAGILLFWSVLSVVVDTAKTGIVGGGRHNMVWAPIRIVFALGLIVPLGATGFSSGQFMVMKVAEWGSNFGTRGWVAYVQAAVIDATLLGNPKHMNPQEPIKKLVEGLTCQVAYNGYMQQSTGNIDAEQRVVAKPLKNYAADGDKKGFALTNDTGDNICGTFEFSNPGNKALLMAATPGGAIGSDPVAAFRKVMSQAHIDALLGQVPVAYNFACDMAADYIYNKSGPSPLLTPDVTTPTIDTANATLTGSGACQLGGAGGGASFDSDGPDASVMDGMIQSYVTAMTNAYNLAKVPLTTWYGPGGGFIQDIEDRGWAGMGIWYQELVRVNSAMSNSLNPTPSIMSGSVNETSCGGGPDAGFWATAWAKIKGAVTDCANASHVEKVTEVMQASNKWWLTASTGSGLASLGATVASGQEQKVDIGAAKVAKLMQGAPDGIMNTLLSWIFPGNGYFLFDVARYGDNVYPLSQLALVGAQILKMAMIAAGTVLGLTVIVAAVPLIGEAAPVIGQVFMPLVFAVITPALLLLYYVPLLPWIRVTFAAMTWIVSVFEAVMLIPIAALSHISTEGEGIGARHTHGLWLNVLTRPILTVVGFVGAVLVANAMILFVNESMLAALSNIGGSDGAIDRIVNTVIYLMLMYTVVNGSFKLVDIIPGAVGKWFGSGATDASFDDGGAVSGGVGGFGQTANQMAGGGMQSVTGGAVRAGGLLRSGVGGAVNRLRGASLRSR